ncbi:MAG: HIT domain-containing protein [Nevskiales bacterium]|nr:HIT domain-containing protein [Nevskiales bacterium]
MDFELHPQLAADTHLIGDWPLCRLLLMNDAQYPWVILVPRRSGIREIYELDPGDQQMLFNESIRLGHDMMRLYSGHKLNVAALGNMVPQLHVHHIVRFDGDPAWPAPVWGRVPAQAYAPDALHARMQQLRQQLEPQLPRG